MIETLQRIVDSYDPGQPLETASTIPSSWYTDPGLHELERRAVFGTTWQLVARADQVDEPGKYVTANVAGEPIVAVRGDDGELRAFYNICRHHAAEVMTEPEGRCSVLRCPYHAWTYTLRGELKGLLEWEGVRDFDAKRTGLLPVRIDTWENLVFVNLSDGAPPLLEYLGDVAPRVAPLEIGKLRFFERRVYPICCNWKVYVDNYLDGGYHIPFLHKGLGSILDNKGYTIEVDQRYCLQWSEVRPAGKGDPEFASARRSDRAYYWWLHPNLMINWYEGLMDVNLVLPRGVDRCDVIFDFYFADDSPAARERNRKSVEVGQHIQQEDVDICESVQRGLGSRAYDTGRLSVRREAGEHLFHRLLHDDLSRALAAEGNGSG